MRIAVLGTGLMGAAIARRLDSLDDVEVVLWNRTRERAEAVGVGSVVSTPAEAVTGSQLVVSSLLDPHSLREVFLGDGGAAAAAGGQLFIETSTAGPAVILEIEEALRGGNGVIVDAPLLGSTAAVLGGTLEIPVGGREEDAERGRRVLDALGSWRVVGGLGTASQLKLLHNSMLAGITTLAGELMAAADAIDIDPESAFWVISRIAPYLRLRQHSFVSGDYLPVTFALKNMVKDLDLGLELYRPAGAAVPMTELTREMYAKAVPDFGELDMAAVSGLYRQLLERAPAGAASGGAADAVGGGR